MGMSVSMRVDSDVLIVTSTGVFALEEAKLQLLEILREVEKNKVDRVLLDSSTLTGEMSLMERFNYAEFAAHAICEAIEAGKIESPKFAYALSPRLVDPERFGENVAVNRGINVRVFEDLHLAREWIGLKQ